MKDDRLISLNAAIEAIHNYWIVEMDKLPRKMVGEYEVLDGDYKTPLRHNKKICEAIEALPTADVAPVTHGRWIKVNGKTAINCSACYHCSWSRSFEDTVKRFNFCPNCGALMDAKGGDESGTVR